MREHRPQRSRRYRGRTAKLLGETQKYAPIHLAHDDDPETKCQIEALNTVLKDFDSHLMTAGHIPLHGIVCLLVRIIEYNSSILRRWDWDPLRNAHGVRALAWALEYIHVIVDRFDNWLTTWLDWINWSRQVSVVDQGSMSKLSSQRECSNVASELSEPSTDPEHQIVNENGSDHLSSSSSERG